jgi:NAD(P)-dependent dehydrogenase (short-subunit alcohol dehydrogenase family)
MPPKKTVLITGCSAGGIGAALAVAFQKRGFHVFATARVPAKMPPEFAHLPDVTRLPLDVTSRASIDAAVAAVRKATGGTLDILVNNAGVPYVVPALDADVRVARDVFDANFFGVLETTKAFAPLLVAAAPGAIVVNICSTAAHITTPWMGASAPMPVSLLCPATF